MLATQSTAEDLQKMKDGLDKDGYSESVLLPAGWMIKFKKHKSNFILLSPQFETFRSVKKMVRHMLQRQYSKESIEKVKENFLTQRKKTKGRSVKKVVRHMEKSQYSKEAIEKVRENLLTQRTQSNSDIDEEKGGKERNSDSHDGKLLSSGWLLKQFLDSDDIILTSPEGKHFLSYQAALEWLSKKEGKLEERQSLEEGLQLEGWRSKDGLPKGWMAKFCPISKEPRMVSGKGTVVYGLIEAEAFPEGEEKKTLVSWARVNSPKEESGDIWESNPCLPEGWLLSRSGQVKESSGVILGSRVEAVRSMIRKQFPPDAIFALWSSLDQEGWTESEGRLPSGWRTSGTSFLSPLMEEVKSKEALLTFLHISKEYTADEVKKTRQALLRK